MISWLMRVFRPTGGRREREADNLLHDIRSRTQLLEGERFLIRRQRDRANRIEPTGHFFVDHLRGADDGKAEE